MPNVSMSSFDDFSFFEENIHAEKHHLFYNLR